MKKNLNGRSVFTMLFLFGLLVLANAAQVYAVNIYSIRGNNLVRFDSAAPGTVTDMNIITGLQTNESIVGIDFRPATGQLYGLGSSSRLYVINTTTGAATAVGAAGAFTLSGTAFGFDFNPTVDRIRIVSNTGQNLRVNPDDGTAITDGAINPAGLQPTAAAYTNNFSGATTTMLFDIDAATDTLYQQNPANSGTLTAVGALGVNFTDINGFDFFSGTNTAFALTSGNFTNPQLYRINLTTGAATLIGNIGAVGESATFNGLAVETGAPASAGFGVIGLTTANQLVRFNSNRAGTILGTTAITGLPAGENILGIDFRPATGQLYGLGSSSRLYMINTTTGAATAVGAAGAFTLSGTAFGFDFNPTVDRIRIVSNTGQNLRVNPNDGTLSATDGTINPIGSAITAAAYTNSFAGATTTTLYDIDTAGDRLVVQNPPNAGTIVNVGPLGLDATDVNGFDIAGSGGTALAALQLAGNANSNLYSIDLTTGRASFVSTTGVLLRGIAITSGSTATNTTALDFDGDRRADYAVFRFSNNVWYINRSSDNSLQFAEFGIAGTDIVQPGDYDGDGRADIAVWRPTNGFFYVLRSSDNQFQAFQFGQNGDEPVARDYDGDGRTDFAVVRRDNGAMVWFITNSSNGSVRAEQFGLASDVTAPGDYDGDGRFDLAVFRGASGQPGTFFVQQSTAGFRAVQFGLGSDVVVPGDYDGDGRTDFAVVRLGSPYQWFVLRSSDNSVLSVNFGTKPHFTAQADYDGDGKTDIAVFDPQTGNFVVRRSSDGNVSFFKFGQNGDYPVANYDTH